MATTAKPQNITPDQKSFGARILMFPLTPSALPSADQIGNTFVRQWHTPCCALRA
jgi:hypothetical protein